MRARERQTCAWRQAKPQRIHTAVYEGYKCDLHHYCDGKTVRQRFRPADLASATQVPPLSELMDGSSAIKPPSQRKLASIVHHESWLVTAACWAEVDRTGDAQACPTREATRFVSCSQPLAGAWIRMLPSAPVKRLRSDRFVWALQRRLGLHVTGVAAEVAQLLRQRGVPVDFLGDYFTSKGDHKAPHDQSLRVWHDMAQASATTAVVLGDKERPEVYRIYNDGHVLDLGEPRQGKGGVDRVIENKVFDPVASGRPDASCTDRGSTHAFGSTEEKAIRRNYGVAARGGTRGWDHRAGVGCVPAHRGDYDDAINRKGNEFWLVLMEVFGGLAPEGVKLFNLYSQRARVGTDRTEYVANDSATRGPHPFAPHWAQLLSAAVVEGDASRSLRAVDKARSDILLWSIRSAPPPAPRARA